MTEIQWIIDVRNFAPCCRILFSLVEWRMKSAIDLFKILYIHIFTIYENNYFNIKMRRKLNADFNSAHCIHILQSICSNYCNYYYYDRIPSTDYDYLMAEELFLYHNQTKFVTNFVLFSHTWVAIVANPFILYRWKTLFT